MQESSITAEREDDGEGTVSVTTSIHYRLMRPRPRGICDIAPRSMENSRGIGRRDHSVTRSARC
jgi:hypothetical protein